MQEQGTQHFIGRDDHNNLENRKTGPEAASLKPRHVASPLEIKYVATKMAMGI